MMAFDNRPYKPRQPSVASSLPGISITIYDPVEKKSRSLTIGRSHAGVIMPTGVEDVARYLETKLGERYSEVTRRSDRRHRRR